MRTNNQCCDKACWERGVVHEARPTTTTLAEHVGRDVVHENQQPMLWQTMLGEELPMKCGQQTLLWQTMLGGIVPESQQQLL